MLSLTATSIPARGRLSPAASRCSTAPASASTSACSRNVIQTSGRSTSVILRYAAVTRAVGERLVSANWSIVIRSTMSEHVGRNEDGGAGDRETDEKRDDRKAHHLTDIELRDGEHRKQPERLNHVCDSFADRDRHRHQPEVGRRVLTNGQRRANRNRPLHCPVPTARRDEQRDEDRGDECQGRP